METMTEKSITAEAAGERKILADAAAAESRCQSSFVQQLEKRLLTIK